MVTIEGNLFHFIHSSCYQWQKPTIWMQINLNCLISLVSKGEVLLGQHRMLARGAPENSFSQGML